MDDEWEEGRAGSARRSVPLTEPLPGRIGAQTDELTRGTLMLTEVGCGI
ncbi:hypothetical protein AB0I10_38615 [Streptomyces sp. NPDC050636]